MCNKLPRYDKNITRNTDKIKTEFFILLSPFGSGREMDVSKEHSLIFLFFLAFLFVYFFSASLLR